MITHLLKKDICRSRVLLAMWFLLIVAQFVLIGSGVNPSDRAMQVAFQMLAVLVPIFQILLLIVIIPHLVHDEPLVGTTAFWFTRPISPSLLVKSKTLFVLLILVALPLVTEVIVLAANSVTPHDIALAVPEIVMGQLALVINIALLAVLTRNFGRFAILAAGALIVLALVAMGIQLGKVFLHPEAMMGGEEAFSLAKSQGVVGTLLTLFAGGSVVAHQYLTRRTVRSVVALVLVMAAVLTTQIWWPIDFLKPAPVDNTHADFDIAAVKVEFTSSPSASDAMSMRGKEAPEKRVQEQIRLTGIPRGVVAEVKRVQPELKLPDGRPVAVKPANGAFFSSDFNADALEAALGGIPVVNGNSRSSSITAQLFLIKGESYKQYADKQLAFSADIDLLVSRYVITGELPLKKGARYDHGSEHVVVTDVLQEPNGVDIVLQQRSVNLLFDRNNSSINPMLAQKNTVYLLVNRKRGEAVEKNNNGNLTVNLSGGRLKNEPVRLSFGPDQSRDRILPEINEQWLADAVLVRLNRVPVAQFTKQLTDKNFFMNGDAWNERHNVSSKDEEKVDKAALAKIQLPQNPSKQQVKDYVYAVFLASQKQSSRSDRDPQVEILMKVGAENLDVLLDFSSRFKYGPSFYSTQAAIKLARPEDKEIILSALSANRDLIPLVLKYGWAADARETLLAALASEQGYLSKEWIKAVASLQDPTTYPDLVKYFTRRDGNRKETYNVIKDLPGIDLKDAVAEAWKRAKYQSGYETLEMASLAAEYGDVEALDAAVKCLKSEKQNNNERKRASVLLREFTPATGSDPELIAWYEANRAKLEFNAVSKKFVVKP